MIRMTLHQSSYDLRAFLRNRQSQFFTLALPILFLVIFASVFGGGGHTVAVPGGRISTSVYYVPGIIALGIIAACFVNLVVSVTAQRERGVLKRRRATPVPAAAIIAGRVAHRDRHRGRHGRGAARHRLGRLRRPRPRPHRPRARGHGGGRRRLVLLPGLRAHLADPQRGRRAAHHPGAPAAAVLHLRRVRRRHDPAALAGRRRRASSRSATWPTRCSPPTTRTPPGSASPAWTC